MKLDSILENVREVMAEKVPEIRHVDWYHGGLDYLDEEQPFDLPAVLIELTGVSWSNTKLMPPLYGKGGVNVYVVGLCHPAEEVTYTMRTAIDVACGLKSMDDWLSLNDSYYTIMDEITAVRHEFTVRVEG